MVPFDYPGFIGNLTYLVEHNFVNISRIDDAVKRILRVKFTMGLFENPLAGLNLASQLGSMVKSWLFHALDCIKCLPCRLMKFLSLLFAKQEHRELAREAARKSFVLLKNGKFSGDEVIPLSRKASKILVAGSHADNLGYQCGGWTIEWQGVSGNSATAGTSI